MGDGEQGQGKEEEKEKAEGGNRPPGGFKREDCTPWARLCLQMKARAWIWCMAGAVTLIGLTGTLLVSAGHQCQGKRHERQNSLLFSLVLLSPEPQNGGPAHGPGGMGRVSMIC